MEMGSAGASRTAPIVLTGLYDLAARDAPARPRSQSGRPKFSRFGIIPFRKGGSDQ